MKIIIPLSICIILLSGGLFPLYGGVPLDRPLNKDDIRHFINAMKPLQILGAKYDFTGNGEDDGEDNNADDNREALVAEGPADFSPMSRSLRDVTDHEAYEEFKTIVQEAGFSSPRQWAAVGDRVMRAYLSLKIIREMTPVKIQEMQENVEQIKKNQYLSPEVRKKILTRMTQTMTMENSLPENIKADQEVLKPYLVRLERLFKEQ